jgi:hypothetical protein
MRLREYARHRGCRLQAVQYAVRAGRIRTDEDGLIDAQAADLAWRANTRESMSACVSNGTTQTGEPAVEATQAEPGMTYADARALTAVYEAQRRKLELQVRTGELVSRTEVERAAFTRFRQLRDACLNLPARLAPILATEPDESKCYALLENEFLRIFEAF